MSEKDKKTNIILRKNATPVYKFLSFIHSQMQDSTSLDNKRILDCGAGGPLPPLALFAQNGFKSTGIDISYQQLEMSQEFVRENNLNIEFLHGDMRSLAFEDESFDYVYEHYSLCHLNTKDAQKAIDEMYRVLKKGGLCFVGVISEDTWPKVMIGEKKKTGEYVARNGTRNHYVYDDSQANKLVEKFKIIDKEKIVKYIRTLADETSVETWQQIYDGKFNCSMDDWISLYGQRRDYFRYVHLYYYLEKK